MERYDARFCRNSVMTSFAGSKSWNFCGRRGVNSSTALRTAVGSNEDIGGNDLNVNREIGRRQNGNGDTVTRTVRCLLKYEADAGLWKAYGRGQFEPAD